MSERRTFAVWMKMTVLTRCEVEARSRAEAERKAEVLNFTFQGPIREVVDWEVQDVEDLADVGPISKRVIDEPRPPASDPSELPPTRARPEPRAAHHSHPSPEREAEAGG